MAENVIIDWARFSNMNEAVRSDVSETPCVYVIADEEKKGLYIGRATDGIKKRYWGGDASSYSAAMHGSRNSIFLGIPDSPESLDDVEVFLIAAEDTATGGRYPVFNKERYHDRAKSVSLKLDHRGDAPYFHYTRVGIGRFVT